MIDLAIFLPLAVVFGIVLGIMMVAYEDGVPFGLYRRIKCKFGKHTYNVGFRGTIRKYYCARCKKARSHPKLEVIQGGKKEWDIGNFKF